MILSLLFPSELNLGSLSSRSNFHAQTISTQTSIITEIPLSPKDIQEENKSPTFQDEEPEATSKFPDYGLEPIKDLDFVEDMLRNTEEELKNIKTDMNQFLNALNEIDYTDNYLSDSPAISKEDRKPKSITSKSISERSISINQKKPKSVTSKPSSARSIGVKEKKHIPIWERSTPRSAPSTARSDMSKKSENNKLDRPTPKPKTTSYKKNDKLRDFDIPAITEEKSISVSQEEYISPPEIAQDQPSTSKKIIEKNNFEKDSEVFNKCGYCQQEPEKTLIIESTPNSTLPLPIPPNTPVLTSEMKSPRNSEEKDIQPPKDFKHKDSIDYSITRLGKKKLSVQTLPAVDIRRPLVTQKLPDVIIQPTDTIVDQEKSPQYDNTKYLELVYKDVNKPVEIPKSLLENEEIKTETDIPNGQQRTVGTATNKSVKIDETPEIIESPDQSEKSLSIREEMNLNIDEIPSVRTLKEIQNYLENRCALIKKRLEEERELKPGEFMSLRWTLNQPPKWKQTETPSSQTASENSTPENIKPILITQRDKKQNSVKFAQGSQYNLDTVLKTWNAKQTAKQNYLDKNKKQLKLKQTKTITNTFAVESPSQELIKDEYTQIHQQEIVLQNKSTQYSLDSSEPTSEEIVDQNVRPNIDSIESNFNEFLKQQVALIKNKNEPPINQSIQYSIQTISSATLSKKTDEVEKDIIVFDKSTQYTISPEFKTIPQVDIPAKTTSKSEEEINFVNFDCCIHGCTESQECYECKAEEEIKTVPDSNDKNKENKGNSEIPEFVNVSSQTSPVYKYWNIGQDIPKAEYEKYFNTGKDDLNAPNSEEIPELLPMKTYSKSEEELKFDNLECCPHGCPEINECPDCKENKLPRDSLDKIKEKQDFFHIPDFVNVSTQTSPIYKCLVLKTVPNVPVPTTTTHKNIREDVPDIPSSVKIPEHLETTNTTIISDSTLKSVRKEVPDLPSPVKVSEKSITTATTSEPGTQKDLTPKKLKPCKIKHPVKVGKEQMPPKISDNTITSDIGTQKVVTFDECTQTCAEFSSAYKINIDDYRKYPSPEQPKGRVPSPHEVESSSDSSCRPTKVKFKRPQKYKTCSTPYTSTSSSTTEKYSSISPYSSDMISLSDGEVKLPCECSTSIGEIHICHLANNIRKRVRRLKQNEESVARENCDVNKSAYVSHKYKYNDNWVTYYITKDKTLSSGELLSENNVTSLSVSSSD